MNKRTIAITAAIAALLGLLGILAAIIGIRGGTPIIIKGGGDGSGESLTVSGPGQYDESVSGDVSTIQVTADNKCWFYQTPLFSGPVIELVTSNADCNIGAADELFLTVAVRFDRTKIVWDGTKFESKLCRVKNLTITPNDTILGKTTCTAPSGSTCDPLDVSKVKKLEIKINEKGATGCP